MTCNLECVLCLLRRQTRRAAQLEGQAAQMEYIAAVMRVVADNAGKYPAPVIVNRVSDVERRFFGEGDPYAQAKTKYNAMLLEMEPAIRARIEKSDNPLRTALLFARAGNYIDFGALHCVDDEMLEKVLSGAVDEALDTELFQRFVDDLEHAKKVVYLTDNCGEIVFDKLFVEQIRAFYPQTEVTVIVKGGPALNDATMQDAVAVGMDKAARVITSGRAMPGMWLPEVSEQSREEVMNADVIIAKGQANVETLRGCGLNVYYILLCKCERFRRIFAMEQLGGIFVNERLLPDDEVEA